MNGKKNIVIFSYNFFPQVDAESFCTTRFASALADAGHNVHVVTMDHSDVTSGKVVSQEVYDALVSPSLKISRVPKICPKRGPIWSRIRYRTAEWHSVNFSNCIKTLRKILTETVNPILVTRVQPINSLIVSWYCRDLVSKWILHISDPMPSIMYIPAFRGIVHGSRFRCSISWLLGWFRCKMEYMWLEKSITKCDAVSVTCKNAVRFYREAYPTATQGKPMFVTTHIGDNKLDALTSNVQVRCDMKDNSKYGKIILHPGELYRGRGGETMVKAVTKLNAQGIKCTFVQLGPIHDDYAREIGQSENVVIVRSSSSQEAIWATQNADVVFVPDFELPLAYSPYLMSKFVYQVYENRPIVVLCKKDSAKHEYALDYPDAGLFWADVGQIETLTDVCSKAFECDVKSIDRTRIRKHFSAQSIAKEFSDNVSRI